MISLPIYLMNASDAFQRGYKDGFDSFRVERTNPYQVGSFSHTDYDAGSAYAAEASACATTRFTTESDNGSHV